MVENKVETKAESLMGKLSIKCAEACEGGKCRDPRVIMWRGPNLDTEVRAALTEEMTLESRWKGKTMSENISSDIFGARETQMARGVSSYKQSQ